VTTPPRYIYGGKVRHIARPDHPTGMALTDVPFCGALGDGGEQANLRVCKRCALSWIAWLERLADHRAARQARDHRKQAAAEEDEEQERERDQEVAS
jgi:hypothetical protein